MAPTLTSFPEELLERILAPCVLAPLYPSSTNPRPQWHRSPSSTRGRLAPLLACKTFLRICTPLFYNTVHISAVPQLQLLLKANPSLVMHTRELILAPGLVCTEAGELLSLCAGLRYLEMSLDSGSNLGLSNRGVVPTGFRDLDTEDFSKGLTTVMKGLSHLVLRKAANVYLTQHRPRYILSHMAKALDGNGSLEHVDLAFRISDDNHTSGPGPMTRLTRALSTLPRLHTFSTHLPSLWNESILCVSANPALERIVLADSSRSLADWGRTGGHGAAGVPGTGIFFMQARKHTRLSDLIRNGTSIIRTRAQTISPFQTQPPPLALGLNMGSGCTSTPTSPCETKPASATKIHFREQQQRPRYPSSPSPSSSNLSAPSSSSHLNLSAAGRLTGSTSWESFVSGTAAPRSPRCQLQ